MAQGQTAVRIARLRSGTRKPFSQITIVAVPYRNNQGILVDKDKFTYNLLLATPATASNDDNKGTTTAPVIAGLLVGIVFVFIFSVLMDGGSGSLLKSSSTSSFLMTAQQQEAMLERGNIAMGFDQNKIMHHFMTTSTGGRIMIVALDSTDSATIKQIKDHVVDIQYEFSQGNFTKPFFIHDQQVPGTDVMAKKKDMIRYSIQQLENGSILVLDADDKELQIAIEQFMQFQGTEHKGH
jgi:hypothetical protein